MDRLINVTVGTNSTRIKKNVMSNVTVRTILEDNEVDYAVATLNLDGATLTTGDLDSTLEELGIRSDHCYLIAVVKADSAV